MKPQIKFSNDGTILLQCPRDRKGSLRIPDTVVEIAENAFLGTELNSIFIPDNVKKIGDYAFFGNEKLKKVRMPKHLTKVGYEIFHDCNNITEPIYNDDTFFRMPRNYVGDYVVKEGIAKIYKEAFRKCKGLTSIVLPRSLKYIGLHAFANCSGLTSITMPDKGIHVCDNPLVGCHNIKDVWMTDTTLIHVPSSVKGCFVVPSHIKKIVLGAFDTNPNITSVKLPESVKHISYFDFNHCDNITEPIFNSTTFVRLPKNTKGKYTIPYGITKINDGAFAGCADLTSVVIPDTVKVIGSYAFMDCTNLKSVVIPDSVTDIYREAFTCCDKLRKLRLPKKLDYIGEIAFGFSAFESMTIPKHTKVIRLNPFVGCHNLKSFTIPKQFDKGDETASYFTLLYDFKINFY